MASWYLVESFGEPTFVESIAYIGPNDIRYLIFMFAAIRVGYKMLFTSPRNNLDGHLNILAQGDCEKFLQAKNTDISRIIQSRPMRTIEAPDLEQLLDDSRMVPVHPYLKSFDEAQHDPCLVLHTTGSTVPPIGSFRPTTEIYQEAKRAYTSMPLFHTSGINATITWALCLGVTLVFGAPHVVPNAAYVDAMHRFADVNASMGAPSLYEDISTQPDWLEHMKGFSYVVVSGAPLSKSAGDTISQYTRVIGNLGATETANLPRLAPSAVDWEYFYWHPTHSGIQMRECQDYPGLFELIIISEWSMNDLYDQHPDPNKPFLWRYRGRKDDVIVLSNGEKLTPVLMETALARSSLVRGAIIVGQGRFQPLALIDLVPGVEHPEDQQSRHELIQRLLPVVAEANKHAPRHGQLDRHHILFADPSKPLHFLGQSKIQRRITNELYSTEIEAFYKHIERRNIAPERPQLLTSQPWRDYDNDDFFRAGVDSLEATMITREINFNIAGGITPTDIYMHPTLSQLAKYVVELSSAADVINGNQKACNSTKLEAAEEVQSQP
ncbi:AMP-binding enzyme domain-containing protein [Hirsutella rhossiliensis]|uniref:AMP-binding enzyme domain-containing protein n=1 Tax=Hirsutella rhossiliensis TaxID=111463 RepID=A0A9P8SD39_9HYPO|nr:AMP-binding enzyme domain-containing protein [Hirsutella rhossiliensis]KAH0957544.1 AMP-binding enzyme domain-containing protein [Hirsutella rhossiliensis]